MVDTPYQQIITDYTRSWTLLLGYDDQTLESVTQPQATSFSLIPDFNLWSFLGITRHISI